EELVARLEAAGLGGFEDQVLFVLQHGRGIGQIRKYQPIAGGGIAGDRFVAEVERDAVLRRSADAASEEERRGGEFQVRKSLTIAAVVEDDGARAQLQAGIVELSEDRE